MDVKLTPEDEQRLQELIAMVYQAVTPEERITERGAETVAIFGHTLLGISQMVAELAAKYGVRMQPLFPPTPLEWRG